MEVIVGILIAVLVVLSVVLSYMACFAVLPKVHTLDYKLEYLKKINFMQGESLEFEKEYQITTYDGQKLWVGFVPGDRENKHFVVLSHGYTSTRYGMYKYAALWRRFGFNCVLYDNRGHGVNKRTSCTFGIREGRDLAALYARLLFGYWFQHVRPIDRLRKNEIPICFVYGADANT